MKPHPQTEGVLSSLQEGDTVAITQGDLVRYAVLVGFDLDGIEVRWFGGELESLNILSARRDLPDLLADLLIEEAPPPPPPSPHEPTNPHIERCALRTL